jgi:hypothetical protein
LYIDTRNTAAWTILVRKPERKRSSGRPRLRWENDIKIDFKEIDYVLDSSDPV